MKNITIISCLFIFLTAAREALSQSAPLWKQPAHVFPQKLSWWDSIYQFPQFQEGRVTFFTGYSPDQKIKVNYNLYYGHMYLIDDNGDTLQVKPSKILKSVQVGNNLFYFDPQKGYIEVIVDGTVSLGSHNMLQIEKMEFVSGNIEAEGTADLRGMPSVFNKYYRRSATYYFIGKDQRLYTPSKFAILKLFPEFKVLLSDYISDQSIDFKRESDLIKLCGFCNELRQITDDDRATSMMVQAGDPATQTLRDSIYQFREFRDAMIVYLDGRQRTFVLNYDMLTGDMNILGAKGDTVKLKNRLTVTTINIDGVIYYSHEKEGFIELLQNGSISLGVNRRIRMVNWQSLKAASTSKAIPSEDPAPSLQDIADVDRRFAKQSRYFFIDKDGHPYIATTSSLYKLFPSSRKEIDNYIALHQTDFKDEEALKLLSSYLAELNGL